MNYTHLSIEERCCLRKYYNEGNSLRKIAKLLGRNVSTISREIMRNKTYMNCKPAYYPHTAQKKSNRHIDIFFLFLMFIIAQLLHNSIQRCYAPGISSLLQFYPKHRQALIGIAAAHILYEQYFGILMRIRVGMRLA